jgi:hypothetical protein
LYGPTNNQKERGTREQDCDNPLVAAILENNPSMSGRRTFNHFALLAEAAR